MIQRKIPGILVILLILVIAAGSIVSVRCWKAGKYTGEAAAYPFPLKEEMKVPGGIFSHQLFVIMD